MTEAEVLDQATLDELLETVGGDTSFLADLIDTYLDDAPKLLAAMQQALAIGSSEDLRRAAHSLKSNSASFGAVALSQMCRELEEIGKSGTLDSAAERLVQLEAEYERVKRALHAARPTE